MGSSGAAIDWGLQTAPFAALLIGDVDRGFGGAVAKLGGRSLPSVGWDDVAQMVGRHAARPILLVEAEGAAEATLLAMLPRIDAVAAALDLPVVVALGLPQIDLVAATLLTRDQVLLVEPDAIERLAAVAAASARMGDPILSDRVREGEAARLERLNEEVARIADLLARLARDEAQSTTRSGTKASFGDRWSKFDDYARASAGVAETAIDPAMLRQAIRARRLRDAFLGPGLFEDPAWDMLLDLLAARLEGSRVSVSSLCIASAVAPTTALRWIGKLTDVGLLIREPDASDRRRAFLALSEKARQALTAYMSAVQRAGLPIP